MKEKYKLETWKKTNWKGTKRETTTTIQRLVKRDKNGQFSKNAPVITKIQKKVYGSGVYMVGILDNKIVVRHKVADRNIEWYEQKKEVMKDKKMYRTSYVLNNVPISKNGYYGFRIVCFSDNQELLKELKQKMKERLIKWIEQCTRYDESEFWFDMYFGYEKPDVTNATRSEKGRYYLTQENSKGIIIKEDNGMINSL